jgi:alpha-L-fucosidase
MAAKPIVIDGISKAQAVNMLGFNGKIKYSISANKLTITPPMINPSNIPCNYAWVFKVAGALK